METPIGVEMTGKFDTKGWKVNPKLDLTVVPQLGDKRAEIINSGAKLKQDVLSSGVFNSTLGVEAQKGNWAVGVDYRLASVAKPNKNLRKCLTTI